jgi:ATP-binding cassette, subfamily B, bacterial
MNKQTQQKAENESMYSLFTPYKFLIASLLFLTIGWNALSLVIPKIISSSIDNYSKNQFDSYSTILILLVFSGLIFLLTYFQSILQAYLAEKVAKDLRGKLIRKIAQQDYDYIQRTTAEKLLTHLTSDVEAVKNFVSQAVTSIVSSIFIIVGASALLIWINWSLALTVIAILPIISIFFWAILSRVHKLFRANQETIDKLNGIINESIFGSSLIRILNSQTYEYDKFLKMSTQSRNIWLSILKLFATLIPSITFLSNMAVLCILILGGHYVILGTLSIGDFTAFNSYLSLLVFPIIVIGFMSNVIAQAGASYNRLQSVLLLPEKKKENKVQSKIQGNINIKDVTLSFGWKAILKDVSFRIKAHTKTAIIGPTWAGKTQLLYVLMWLVKPDAGVIEYDDINLEEIDKISFHKQVGVVFQDSNLFNLSIRDNITFWNMDGNMDFQKAIDTAELHDFMSTLPMGIDTIVSERGTSLSWWQKQRIMLARVLTLNPNVIFFDDFTARLDINTEQEILKNIEKNYPDTAIISVTQKIESIKDYDQIILLMEWEILSIGTHEELLASSPEYNQIYDSQFSTTDYELPTL